MLILSRRTLQTIMIGDSIQIKIIEVNKKNVLIGIRAPKDITVHRQEIYDRINSPVIVVKKQRLDKEVRA